MSPKKNADKSAVVAGSTAANNKHLNTVIEAVRAGYTPHRIGKSNRQLRIDHTAMIPNRRPVYGLKKIQQGEDVVVVPQLLFRAGWYLSAEEAALRDSMLKDPDVAKYNDKVYAAMEEAGMVVEKDPQELPDAKVIDETTTTR